MVGLNMLRKMQVSDKVLRLNDRDIIKVEIRPDYTQAFYKSSGRNSGKAGEWLPLSGIVHYEDHVIWFDKHAFVKPQVPEELHRYGTEELKEISKKLAQINIPKGKEAKASEINKWLHYE